VIIAGSSPHRVRLLGTSYAAFWLLGWSLVVVPTLVRSIERDFGVQDAAVSVLYFLGACLFAMSSLAGGSLVGRWGRRTVLAAGMSASMAGFGLAAWAPSWPNFVAGMCMANAGSGLIDAQLMALFLDLYPGSKATAMSLLNGFLSLGSLLAPLAIGVAVTAGAPWRSVMAGTAAVFAVMVPALVWQGMPSGRRETWTDEMNGAAPQRGSWNLLPFVCLAVGIALSTGVTYGVTDWLIRFLRDVPLDRATVALSAFWAGIAISRFAVNWIVEQVKYSTLVISCVVMASLALMGVVVVPFFPIRVMLFACAGLFYGPGFPLILAIGATMYPRRIPVLTGGLTMAASCGVIVYPPVMGMMANTVGLQIGMLASALLGLPIVGCVVAAVWPGDSSM